MTMRVTDEPANDGCPWGVYDCYCLRCANRFVSVAPVAAEATELWECGRCCVLSATWQPYPGDERDETAGEE